LTEEVLQQISSIGRNKLPVEVVYRTVVQDLNPAIFRFEALDVISDDFTITKDRGGSGVGGSSVIANSSLEIRGHSAACARHKDPRTAAHTTANRNITSIQGGIVYG